MKTLAPLRFLPLLLLLTACGSDAPDTPETPEIPTRTTDARIATGAAYTLRIEPGDEERVRIETPPTHGTATLAADPEKAWITILTVTPQPNFRGTDTITLRFTNLDMGNNSGKPDTHRRHTIRLTVD